MQYASPLPRVRVDTPDCRTVIGRIADDGTPQRYDLDGTFIVIDEDDGARIRVNGWCCRIDLLPG